LTARRLENPKKKAETRNNEAEGHERETGANPGKEGALSGKIHARVTIGVFGAIKRR
jgi:hypothetical protein